MSPKSVWHHPSFSQIFFKILKYFNFRYAHENQSQGRRHNAWSKPKISKAPKVHCSTMPKSMKVSKVRWLNMVTPLPKRQFSVAFSWLVPNVCFEPGKQCGQYSANVHYGMTLRPSQLDFFLQLMGMWRTQVARYIYILRIPTYQNTHKSFGLSKRWVCTFFSFTYPCDGCSCLRKQ